MHRLQAEGSDVVVTPIAPGLVSTEIFSTQRGDPAAYRHAPPVLQQQASWLKMVLNLSQDNCLWLPLGHLKFDVFQKLCLGGLQDRFWSLLDPFWRPPAMISEGLGGLWALYFA